MAIEQPITAKNDKPNKTEKIVCDCGLLWSLAHQFTYLRLSDEVGENEYKLVDLFEARAKRIAATYARFYLETEDGGTPEKRGRYYWMALGAFASKTVACLLATWQLNSMYIAFKTIPRGLGQGNLWLFTDIAASHWFYNHFPENFQKGMMCNQQRDANKLEDAVKEITNDLPWAAKSIATINNFVPSSDVIEGFKLVEKIENESNLEQKQEFQLDHLMAIAEHEQGAVLQPLIYKNPDFAAWAKIQRSKWVKWMSPTYQLTFTHECDIDDEELKSVAPDDMIVEDFESRMDWIGKAAQKFHRLMHTKQTYMEQELQTMAGWVNTPDAALVY
ncbi:DUF2515 family protein [Aliikangiella sp. IMCC44359]|uniref:DUF2515 family protein n=1 Tax=Aliikangiella sp. IMCC44359 TaxID=3459125 RepID=UPI00403AAD87